MGEEPQLLHLHGKLYMALSYAPKLVKQTIEWGFDINVVGLNGQTRNDFVIKGCAGEHFSLQQTYRFDRSMDSLTKKSPHHHFIACLSLNSTHRTSQLFLLGCHLIMSYKLSFEEALLALRPSRYSEDAALISALENSLRGFCCAKCLNWIDFNSDIPEDAQPYLQMDEYMHYSRFARH
jgi:hypothetical protein